MTRHATRHLWDDADVFAENLRVAQAVAGLTNEGLARDAEIPLRLVQRWRAGAGMPSGRYLAVLCLALGKNADWFYTDHSNEPEPAVEAT